MMLPIQFEREDDGRWIAEIPSLHGAMAYGATKEEAAANVEAIADDIVTARPHKLRTIERL